jgi:signal transduction histidine kinase
MNVTSLTPVFTSLRMALNLMVVGLVGFIVVRESLDGGDAAFLAIALAILFLATYVAGALLLRRFAANQLRVALPWLGILTIEALALVWISPNAAYLVFPLFFLYLHLIPRWWGVVAVTGCTLLTILILGIEDRLTSSGVIGPLVGASVAIAIGLGYRALYWENRERQRLIEELLITREELIRKEREAGMLAERARLAREIHDTVAQGLSSIQLLLHAAERADGERPGIEHIRLARETAALNLEETRRFIRELTPVALEGQSLVHALERLAQSTSRASNGTLEVTFRAIGDVAPLPMTLEAAILRIAQGALTNVVQHAQASRATMTLTFMENSVSLDVVDTGCGFDVTNPPLRVRPGGSESFGLVAMRERVEQLGGTITIESEPGMGTAIAATFGWDA